MAMDVFTLNGSRDDEAALAAAVTALEAGELVVAPTETVYGLLADPRGGGATERIYAAKQRDRGKPLQLLATGLEAIEAMGFTLSATERRLAERFWPGGLTLILEAGGKTEGFRVPALAVPREIARRLGGVVRATSANASGEPDALTAEAAIAALGDAVAVVLDGGPVTGGIPSTVTRVTARGRIEVLREGALSEDALNREISNG